MTGRCPLRSLSIVLVEPMPPPVPEAYSSPRVGPDSRGLQSPLSPECGPGDWGGEQMRFLEGPHRLVENQCLPLLHEPGRRFVDNNNISNSILERSEISKRALTLCSFKTWPTNENWGGEQSQFLEGPPGLVENLRLPLLHEPGGLIVDNNMSNMSNMSNSNLGWSEISKRALTYVG